MYGLQIPLIFESYDLHIAVHRLLASLSSKSIFCFRSYLSLGAWTVYGNTPVVMCTSWHRLITDLEIIPPNYGVGLGPYSQWMHYRLLHVPVPRPSASCHITRHHGGGKTEGTSTPPVHGLRHVADPVASSPGVLYGSKMVSQVAFRFLVMFCFSPIVDFFREFLFACCMAVVGMAGAAGTEWQLGLPA